jgi:hypothetical protein
MRIDACNNCRGDLGRSGRSENSNCRQRDGKRENSEELHGPPLSRSLCGARLSLRASMNQTAAHGQSRWSQIANSALMPISIGQQPDRPACAFRPKTYARGGPRSLWDSGLELLIGAAARNAAWPASCHVSRSGYGQAHLQERWEQMLTGSDPRLHGTREIWGCSRRRRVARSATPFPGAWRARGRRNCSRKGTARADRQ